MFNHDTMMLNTRTLSTMLVLAASATLSLGLVACTEEETDDAVVREPVDDGEAERLLSQDPCGPETFRISGRLDGKLVDIRDDWGNFDSLLGMEHEEVSFVTPAIEESFGETQTVRGILTAGTDLYCVGEGSQRIYDENDETWTWELRNLGHLPDCAEATPVPGEIRGRTAFNFDDEEGFVSTVEGVAGGDWRGFGNNGDEFEFLALAGSTYFTANGQGYVVTADAIYCADGELQFDDEDQDTVLRNFARLPSCEPSANDALNACVLSDW